MPHAITANPDSMPSALDRISRLSKPFSILFTVLMTFMVSLSVVMIAAALVYDGQHIRVTADVIETGKGQLMFMADITEAVAQTTMALGDLPLHYRILFIVNLALLQWGSLAMIFRHCRALFRLYEDGAVFSPENAAVVRQIAFWLIIWGAAPAIGHQIATLSGVVDNNWFRFSSIAGVMAGGFLYVVAKVMDLGRELEHDRAQYI